ncbi:hypothetical protein GRS96_05170 [Rathayibacter sp. VKM Ac-2803]|uniref:hypothetical protein n=1 Tax=unclassified Rathayibacter TaxID=2609250 RepID=UPI00135CEA7E|nr:MULTISPECIES: hypothetical protein [unclassified Rathayibacter]MWV48670.1 hypothetical protein [Rathayibacter sp. VKM Ac-2803]MWV60696.1 hypothetical protein [Rathayibacter sp. VKM Ac-2754]
MSDSTSMDDQTPSPVQDPLDQPDKPSQAEGEDALDTPVEVLPADGKPSKAEG